MAFQYTPTHNYAPISFKAIFDSGFTAEFTGTAKNIISSPNTLPGPAYKDSFIEDKYSLLKRFRSIELLSAHKTKLRESPYYPWSWQPVFPTYPITPIRPFNPLNIYPANPMSPIGPMNLFYPINTINRFNNFNPYSSSIPKKGGWYSAPPI